MVSTTNKQPARCLAVLGTASDVGKSVMVTALCRVASDLGISVAPFKAQNMSNNSFVTACGGEIGRAQVAQAEAARIPPHVDMNPVLLKPNSDIGSQVVLRGKPLKESSAMSYGALAMELKHYAVKSLDRLRRAFELIIMEGAGSCAEINLRARDFVNFEMAMITGAPVLLVADIDRGGVFAQIVGTLEIISPAERERIKGIIINRFRGDPALFTEGISFIEKRTGVPVIGVIPYLPRIGIDSEDAVVLDRRTKENIASFETDKVHIAVVRLPHISNFTDFSLLESDPAVTLDYIHTPKPLGRYDILLLPGTKNVRGDLKWMREVGFEERIREYVYAGGRICGICGGFQMLGKSVVDSKGIEGSPGATPGLNLLNISTTLFEQKMLTHTNGTWLPTGDDVSGYEIHQGRTEPGPGYVPLIRITKKNDEQVSQDEGALSANGRVFGTYLHGLFDLPEFRRSFLLSLRPDIEEKLSSSKRDTAAVYRESHYDRLADHIRQHADLNLLKSFFYGNIR